jgi:hypothetical protein
MATEEECVTCQISTIKAAARNKMPHTPMTKPSQTIFIDILHLQSGNHVTPDSTFAFLLILFYAYSRFTKICELDEKTTESVIKAIWQYTADCGCVDEFGYVDIEKIHSATGTQFIQGFYRDKHINLSLAASKNQVQNHFAEHTWQTVNTMAHSMVVHAGLPDSFLYHVICYASAVLNILPLKGLVNKDGKSATPAELFHGAKPCIGDFRVFGCPYVLKKWITHFDGKVLTNQAECGIRGIFIGFANNQTGFLVYLPSTRRIAISEMFYSMNHFRQLLSPIGANIRIVYPYNRQYLSFPMSTPH